MSAPGLKLIIGHVDNTSVKVWVQGSSSHTNAKVTIIDEFDMTHTENLVLEFDDGFTGIVTFGNLRPDTRHTCTLKLSPGEDSQDASPAYARGGFRTAPEASAEGEPFAFLLCSCNKRKQAMLEKRSPFFHVERRRQFVDARFTIHAGDNIYYDGFAPNKRAAPSFERYAKTYEGTWGADNDAKQVLTEAANYMVMDDHDIYNNFNSKETLWGYPRERFLGPGYRAYDLFQHSHNPHTYGQDKRYYAFDWGAASFFAMDVRTERDLAKGQMISTNQMNAFKKWATENEGRVRFVISAVPILVGARFDNEDKWSGKTFTNQRDELLMFLADHNATVVFLTGDMHASYHASMDIHTPTGEHVVLHELMASPLDHWLRHRVGLDVEDRDTQGYSFNVHMSDFESQCSAMEIEVSSQNKEDNMHHLVKYTAFRTDGDDHITQLAFAGTIGLLPT